MIFLFDCLPLTFLIFCPSVKDPHDTVCLRPSQPLELQWWCRDEDGPEDEPALEDGLVLCRNSGALTVSSISSFSNLLGENPEYLSGIPMVSVVFEKKLFFFFQTMFFILEKKRTDFFFKRCFYSWKKTVFFFQKMFFIFYSWKKKNIFFQTMFYILDKKKTFFFQTMFFILEKKLFFFFKRCLFILEIFFFFLNDVFYSWKKKNSNDVFYS